MPDAVSPSRSTRCAGALMRLGWAASRQMVYENATSRSVFI
jgi:hypothetical protein